MQHQRTLVSRRFLVLLFSTWYRRAIFFLLLFSILCTVETITLDGKHNVYFVKNNDKTTIKRCYNIHNRTGFTEKEPTIPTVYRNVRKKKKKLLRENSNNNKFKMSPVIYAAVPIRLSFFYHVFYRSIPRARITKWWLCRPRKKPTLRQNPITVNRYTTRRIQIHL